MNPTTAMPEGFWGAVTSTVDWCEPNYVHSVYVAEWFNTLSCIPMVIIGVAGWMLHTRQELRVRLAFLSITVIGLGSVAFHGTLKASSQALDELPMLWSALIVLFILIERGPQRRHGRKLPLALLALGVGVTTGYALLEGPSRFALFISAFAGAEILCFILGLPLYRSIHEPTFRNTFRLGVTLHAVALTGWLIDTHACAVVSHLPGGLPNPQLHAWWHVLVASGIYLLYVVLAYVRADITGRSPRIARAAGLVPYVRVAAP
ncbi:MAG: ceramidase [Deltaproteobacteria bacterium]|nr:ceramidase [Deltaproteobacteria bacterium]